MMREENQPVADWRGRINLFLGVTALAAAILGFWWI